MKHTRKKILATCASLGLALAAAAQTAPDNSVPPSTPTGTNPPVAANGAPAPEQSSNSINQAAENDNPVVLSPLDVTAVKDVGYGAATTASTSKLVQNYIDVPQTVNVVTSEFLQDYTLQDVREALEYEPNLTFGLNNNSYSTRIRGAIVTSTYIDGVASSYSFSAEPMDFFDRIEVVKGPSSVAFGLGEPGGLINYVSKTPQGVDATSLYAGYGEWDNYRFGVDLQRVDPSNSKLSYRIVAFDDGGNYETPNINHRGYGTQFSIRYDVDPTLRIDLITAYSNTNYPSEGIENSIWQQKTIYQTWQITNLGASIYEYLPGTVFQNGSVFGGSGQLPTPGTDVGVLGTGKLAAVDSNLNPADWASGGITYEDWRSTLVINKTFWDNHISLRNATTLEFSSNNGDDETPDEVVSVPGTNTYPAAQAGNPGYGEPVGYTLTGVGAENGYQGVPGQPFFGVGFSLTHGQGNASARNDELDLLGDWKFAGMELQGLAGGDIYDSESNNLGWQWPDVYPGTGLPYEVNVYSSHNASVPIQNNYTITGFSNSHSWGDGEYVQGDLKLFHDMLDLNAGWRIDFFDTENRNYLAPSLPASYSTTGWLNTKGAPRYAITVKPLPWLSIYELYTVHHDPAQFTNKYFLASGTEWGSYLQSLYPESELEEFQPGGTTIETGAKASFLNGRVYASVAIFHDITQGQLNPIVAINYINPDGTDTQIGVQQVQGTNVHGIEAEVFGQITDRLSGIINYGETRGYYPEFSNGTPDIIDPSATVSGHLKFDLGDLHGHGFYINFGGEGFSPYTMWQEMSPVNGYIGTTPITAGETISSYYSTWQYVLDAGVGYRWRTGRYHQELYFNCDNFTNQLVSIGTVTPWTVEPLRQWFVTYKVGY
ncbi:MAG TPA: TonB-dependent receptor plug domain-containing protein [Opitutaceae bacterium]|jgi:outer membrane receptor protein involved in Fe transport|nr:TonB-dependent receptor plug domain-containing protein [Opitutaceae bacterium]